MKTARRTSHLTLLMLSVTISLLGCGGGSSSNQIVTSPLTVNYFTDGVTYPPANQQFPQGYWSVLEVAHEIFNLGPMYDAPESVTAVVAGYKNGGSNQVPDDVWNGTNGYAPYEPPYPYIKNSTRYLQFNLSHFMGSPGEPVGTTTFITTSDGYTWASMTSSHNAMIPFKVSDYAGNKPPVLNAFAAGNWVLDPVAGSVKYTTNKKAQNMLFYSHQNNDPQQAKILRFFIKDNYGNIYIMHSSGAADESQTEANFNAATLPTGWKKYSGYLPASFVMTPTIGFNNTRVFNVLRDNKDSGYHQIFWGNSGMPPQDVDGPLAIWGGNTSDTLFGAPNRDIYAGGGNDVVTPGSGSHFIDGGTGVDTCIYDGKPSDYKIVQLANGQYKITKPVGAVDTLNSVEKLKFSNGEELQIADAPPDVYVETSATLWLKNLQENANWK